jgi:hypothetical protein
LGGKSSRLKSIKVKLKEFNELEIVIKKRLVRTLIKFIDNLNNIEEKNIKDIIKLCENNIGNKYLIPKKGVKVYVNHGVMEIIREEFEAEE